MQEVAKAMATTMVVMMVVTVEGMVATMYDDMVGPVVLNTTMKTYADKTRCKWRAHCCTSSTHEQGSRRALRQAALRTSGRARMQGAGHRQHMQRPGAAFKERSGWKNAAGKAKRATRAQLGSARN